MKTLHAAPLRLSHVLLLSMVVLVPTTCSAGSPRAGGSGTSVAQAEDDTPSRLQQVIELTPKGTRYAVFSHEREENGRIVIAEQHRALLTLDAEKFVEEVEVVLSSIQGSAMVEASAEEAQCASPEAAEKLETLHEGWKKRHPLDIHERVLKAMNQSSIIKRQALRKAGIASPKQVEAFHCLSYGYIIEALLCGAAEPFLDEDERGNSKIVIKIPAKLSLSYGKGSGYSKGQAGESVLIFGQPMQKKDAAAWYLYHAQFHKSGKRASKRPLLTDKAQPIKLTFVVNKDNRLEFYPEVLAANLPKPRDRRRSISFDDLDELNLSSDSCSADDVDRQSPAC